MAENESEERREARQRDELEGELKRIYTPGKPISDPAYFSGRQQLIADIRDLMGVRQIFVIYGESGVGKTSFYNILLHGKRSVVHTCTRKDDFITIFLNVLIKLGVHLTESETTMLVKAGYEVGAGSVKLSAGGEYEATSVPLQHETIGQSTVLRRLERVKDSVDAIVFDEAQRINDIALKEQLRDLFKAMSDQSIDIPVFFVGIAYSDQELLPDDPEYQNYKMRHCSINRIPPMTVEEIEDIINLRERKNNIKFEPEVKRELAVIAAGFPSLAHTLALFSCFSWVTENIQKRLKNWALSLNLFGIGKWLRGRGMRVEKIGLSVERRHFCRGVQQLLREFGRNHESETVQLQTVLRSEDPMPILNLLVRIAEAGETGLNSEASGIAEPAERQRLRGMLDKNITVSQDERWRLSFSRLGAMARAYKYLLDHEPDAFKQAVG